MSTSKTLGGVSHTIPALGESGWGANVTTYLIAIADSCLATDGGARTLLSELNLGTNYGLKSLYLKSTGTNVGSTGVVRLANNESIVWRNQANGADLALKVNASNALEYNGVVLGTQGLAATDSPTFAGLTLTGFSGVVKASAGVLSAAAIVNADIDAAAAIVDTKLATIATAGKVSNSATTAASANTASAIVARDGSGNFAAGTITANLTGNASGTAANVTGTVAIANGGTGETSANDALNALLPDQASNGGKVLSTNGTDTEWLSVATTAVATASADGLLSAAGFRHLSGNYGTVDANDSNRTIANTDGHHMVYTGFTANRDVTLPTTDVTAGEVFILENTTAFDMVVKASNGNALTVANSTNIDATVKNGFVVVRAKQATPTTPAHWQVIDVFDQPTISTTFTAGGTGGGSSGAVTVRLTRRNTMVTAFIPGLSLATSTNSNTTNSVVMDAGMPTRCLTHTEGSLAFGMALVASTAVTASILTRPTSPNLYFLKDGSSGAWTHASSAIWSTNGGTVLSWNTN